MNVLCSCAALTIKYITFCIFDFTYILWSNHGYQLSGRIAAPTPLHIISYHHSTTNNSPLPDCLWMPKIELRYLLKRMAANIMQIFLPLHWHPNTKYQKKIQSFAWHLIVSRHSVGREGLRHTISWIPNQFKTVNVFGQFNGTATAPRHGHKCTVSRPIGIRLW